MNVTVPVLRYFIQEEAGTQLRRALLCRFEASLTEGVRGHLDELFSLSMSMCLLGLNNAGVYWLDLWLWDLSVNTNVVCVWIFSSTLGTCTSKPPL